MGQQLRIFVSSTMKDLANERLAVCQRLSSFNVEPVNAETLGPSGGNSWARIQPEIASSDAMILLLGERYGWIPKTGPGADLKVSVTELEVIEARKHGILILPFAKRLDDDADRTSDDAIKRDAFRKRIKDWDERGLFVQSFDLAPDLADKVAHAVIGMLTDEFQRQRIRDHAEATSQSRQSEPPPAELAASILPSIPGKLREAVQNRTAVLFAGSGISLSAGFPSAPAFAERFVQLIKAAQNQYFLTPAASTLAAVATDLESLRGRDSVTNAVRTLMDAPQNPQPTLAHLHAVQLFPRILTTNFDTLFERAAKIQALDPALVIAEIPSDILPTPVIVKLHGSSDAPESLMINEMDILFYAKARPNLWRAALRLLREQTVVVIGSSLRDPSVLRLFAEVGNRPTGYYVSPIVSPSDRARLSHWNLECIEASADQFLAALAQAVPALK